MQSRNAYRQIFPSIETVEDWNSSGDQIILSPKAILQKGKITKMAITFVSLYGFWTENNLGSRTVPVFCSFYQWESLKTGNT